MPDTPLHIGRVGYGGADGLLFVHKHNQIVNEQCAFIDHCGGCNNCADGQSNGSNRAGVKGVVTNQNLPGEHLLCNEQIEDQIGAAGHKTDKDVPATLRQDQIAQSLLIFAESFLKARDEGVA